MNLDVMDAKEIKRLIRRSGIYSYQVAEEIGISEPTIIRWFRKFDEEKTKRILKAIDTLVEQNAAFN